MKKWLTPLAIFFALICSNANAQWQVPSGECPVGLGAGVTGFSSVPCPAATFSTKAVAAARNLSLYPVGSLVRTSDYGSVGSGGGAFYQRVSVSCTATYPLACFTAADGSFWQIYPINNTIEARQFGATCDGIADDKAAFQALADVAILLKVAARFTGTCRLASGFSITNGIDFGGVSMWQDTLTPDAGVSAITINTPNSTSLHDFYILYSSANSGDAGVRVTATTENFTSRFWNLTIDGADVGIDFVRASGWTVTTSFITNFKTNGIVVDNTRAADSGDTTIASTFLASISGANACVLYKASGGLRFINNKCLGASAGLTYGLQMNLTAGAATGDLFIANNSIEGLTTSGAAIRLARAGATGSFTKVNISNNEIGNGTAPLRCLHIPTDASGQWVNDLVFNNNTCAVVNSASAVSVDIDSAASIVIAGNVFNSVNASTKMFNIGSGVTDCQLGLNTKDGTFAADSITAGVCTLNLQGLASGTSGGVPYYSAAGKLSFSAALAANQLVLGGGAGTAPATLGSLGTTTTLLHGNAGGAPTFGAVVSADLNITTTTCTNQFLTAISAAVAGTCTTDVLASAQHANQGTTTTLLHGNASGNPSWAAVVSADLNITTTTCSNQFLTAISATATGTCTTDTLASAQHANQGSTTTVLHGNAAGNPSWGAIVSADLNITTTTCTNQFLTAISATATGTCTTDTLASAQHANQGTTTTVLHGNAAGNPSWTSIVSADLNITTTTCTNQFLTAISATATGTCTTDTLAGAQHANQGTTTTVLHGNAAGNPSWAAISLTADVSGTLGSSNGGCAANTGAWTSYTPTVNTSSVNFTLATATGSYWQCGKTVHWQAVATVTTVGASATGCIQLTTPTTPQSTALAIGQDDHAFHHSTAVLSAGATTASFVLYNGSCNVTVGDFVNGTKFYASGTYETQ